MEDLFDHQPILETIPHEPGCYIMRDKKNKIVYVGKAKNLNTRVRSYFSQSGDARAFIAFLPKVLGRIETIVTANEKEAILLENTLIKAHKPRFNIRLKDDKSFLSLKVNLEKEWPRVEVIRSRPQDRKKKKNQKLFGPFHNAKSLRQTLGILNRYFQLRTCPDNVLNSRQRPCLQHQIKRCPAPCVLAIDPEEYAKNLKEALLFLDGKADELKSTLNRRMLEASEELEFESAARIRDQLKSISRSMQRQHAISESATDRDVLGIYRNATNVRVEILFVRKGRLEGARGFSFENQEFPDQNVLSNFLNQYYVNDRFIPQEILIPIALPETQMETLGEILSEHKGRKVAILVPQRGDKKALLATAALNAKTSYEQSVDEGAKYLDLLGNLQNKLKLKNFPKRIECFDISNFQGKQIVGSQVVFIDGVADKSEYRRFRMKEVLTQDDFASMHEMLNRRLIKVVKEEEEGPDLIVIDGGKGQLGQVVAVLQDHGLNGIDVVSLAKSRVDKTGFSDSEVTRSPERVFIPNRKNPVVLKPHAAELYLLERLRDEAHRFAITYHKELRRKETLTSELDKIPGIGPKTRRDLLRHFGGVKKVKRASIDELLSVEGIGLKTAQTIYAFFENMD